MVTYQVLVALFLPQASDPAVERRRGDSVIINMGSINGLKGMAGSAPGPTLTEGNDRIRDHLEPMIARLPSRNFSTPEHVAAAVVFLAGDDGMNIHGSTLSVDGGFSVI